MTVCRVLLIHIAVDSSSLGLQLLFTRTTAAALLAGTSAKRSLEKINCVFFSKDAILKSNTKSFNFLSGESKNKVKERIHDKLLSLRCKTLITAQPTYLYNLISVQPCMYVAVLVLHLSSILLTCLHQPPPP